MNSTLRNLIGGLAGGSTGILAFHFAGFWTMLAACTIGFIVGFWADEIWRGLCKPLTLSEKLGGSRFAHLYGRTQKTLTNIVCGISWVLSLPQRLYVWISESPANRADLISWVTAILWFGCAFGSTHWFIAQHPNVPFVGWLWILAAFFSVIGVLAVISGAIEDPSDRHVRWRETNLIRYSVVELFKAAYVGITVTIIGGSVVMIFLLSHIVFPLVVGCPALIAQKFVLAVISLSTLSVKKAHRLGVTVTLIITTGTAFITRGLLSDQTVMIVALLNGVASGLLSIGAHHLCIWLNRFESFTDFPKWNVREMVSRLPVKILEPVCEPMLDFLRKPLDAAVS